MTKENDEAKILEAVSCYRMAVVENRDDEALAESAYAVADAYADASISHPSWRREACEEVGSQGRTP